MEINREQVQCDRWEMTVNEDDICDYFEFATYWAFNCTEEDQERRKMKLENAKAKANTQEGCYIATAVYGRYDNPKVMVLRRYRDEVLKKSRLGIMFIKIYYAVSPCLAKRLKNNSWINGRVRVILDKIIMKLEK